MTNIKVKNVMTKNPVFVSPDATLQEAAKKMQESDCGVLPVGAGGKFEGMITDRDIVIRAVSEGKDPAKSKVSYYMSDKVYECKEEDSLKEAAKQMCQHHVSRLIVKDNNGRVSGILSFGCILRNEECSDEIADVVACATGRKVA